MVVADDDFREHVRATIYWGKDNDGGGKGKGKNEVGKGKNGMVVADDDFRSTCGLRSIVARARGRARTTWPPTWGKGRARTTPLRASSWKTRRLYRRLESAAEKPWNAPKSPLRTATVRARRTSRGARASSAAHISMTVCPGNTKRYDDLGVRQLVTSTRCF